MRAETDGIRLRRCTIRDHIFRYSLPGSKERRRVELPFGIGLNCDQYQFRLNDDTLTARQIAPPRRATIIAPPFQVDDSIRHPATPRRRLRLRLWVVSTDSDRLRARRIIEREHYLSAPRAGMLLVAAFASIDEQIDLLRYLKHRHPRKGETRPQAWPDDPDGIVGVAVLQSLQHGNPARGRAEFATAATGDERWRYWKAGRIVRRIRIAWASRFAVHRPYHGLGLGTVLAKHLKAVARAYRAPAADFLEVITTQPLENEGRGEGFLIHAGYRIAPHTMPSGPMLTRDAKGRLVSLPAVKRYYWADLRDAAEHQ